MNTIRPGIIDGMLLLRRTPYFLHIPSVRNKILVARVLLASNRICHRKKNFFQKEINTMKSVITRSPLSDDSLKSNAPKIHSPSRYQKFTLVKTKLQKSEYKSKLDLLNLLRLIIRN